MIVPQSSSETTASSDARPPIGREPREGAQPQRNDDGGCQAGHLQVERRIAQRAAGLCHDEQRASDQQHQQAGPDCRDEPVGHRLQRLRPQASAQHAQVDHEGRGEQKGQCENVDRLHGWDNPGGNLNELACRGGR